MNKRIKQFAAVLSAIALIISSVTVYRSEKVNAAGEWTEITGLKYQSNMSDMTLYYQVAKGNEGQPISRDGDFYLMVRPENFASENSANVYFDEGMTTEGTTPIADGVGRKDAYQYIMGFAITANNVQENKYYSLRFEYGTYDVVYYFYTGEDPESGGGGGGETPTPTEPEDDVTEDLQEHSINEDNSTVEEVFQKQKSVSDGTWYDYTDYYTVAEVTSDDNTMEPAKAIDNSVEEGSRWGTQASDNHWLLINLGKARKIREIDINWGTASAAAYNVEVSEDGKAFKAIAKVDGRSGNVDHRLDTITFNEAQEYQYIRINCKTRATDYGFSIWELAIYGPDEQFDDEVVDNGESALTATKEDLSVEGFQIQANDEHNDSYVNFRTVCKAPNIGGSISAGGDSYTVKAYGTIYALDSTNTSGDHSKDNIKVYHTMLTGSLQDIGDGVQAYLGANKFVGENPTYGYEATPIGTINGWNPLDANHTYYSRTMTKMDENMANTIYVRAFVVAESGEFIYSEDTAEISVAEIADYLYENSMSKNVVAHEYLFNNILHNTILQEAGSRYYRYDAKEYGWNGSLYTPQNSMFS